MTANFEERLRHGRIMIVDDEVKSLCLIEAVLTRFGFTNILKEANPIRAIEDVDDFKPDLIITDLWMPQLTGWQLMEHARTIISKDDFLPILVLTGSFDSADKRRALVAGATEFLLKPFDPSELLMRIRTLLRTRFQHLEIQEQNRMLEARVQERTERLAEAMQQLKETQKQVVQQERLRAFASMAGGIVHDFNNALMSVIGYSEVLLKDRDLLKEPELVEQYLQTIHTAGRDAAQVVSRLREFYRPREESDVFTPVNVNKVIEEAVAMTQPKWKGQALENGRQVEMNLELVKVPLVNGNASELREAIMNLIFNSVDAMTGNGMITLRTRAEDAQVVVEVEDTGSGMSPEVRQRCLEPFFTTKGDRGTGLGLAMVFGIIGRHDGTFEIESEEGKGTLIRFAFPPYDAEHHHGAEQPQDAVRGLKVLVVDDDPNSLFLVKQYLNSDGHEVLTAMHGWDALRQVDGGEFDLVITDHGMPGMNGIQLAERLLQMGEKVPVVLLTGFSIDMASVPPVIRQVMRKPVVQDEIRRVVREVAGERAPSGAATVARSLEGIKIVPFSARVTEEMLHGA